MKKIPQPRELPPARSLADALLESQVQSQTGPAVETSARSSVESPVKPEVNSTGGSPAQTHSDSQGDAAAATRTGPASRAARRAGAGSHPQGRRYARERALQALYQWDLSAAPIGQVRQDILQGQEMNRVDVAYFLRLYDGIASHVQPVDDALAGALDRTVEELDPIERAVLRVGAFELQQCLDTPARVIINEAVEITRRYGADQGHKYVNGVLDKLALQLRPVEMRR